MKVIKLRVAATKDAPKRCTCKECDAELEYIPEDVHIGWMGIEYVTCPECSKETAVGDVRKAKPIWPLTFYHTSKNNRAKDVSDEVVNEMMDKVIKTMQSSEEECDFSANAAGNAMVIGWKNADGIDIYVTKDYWEDTIF